MSSTELGELRDKLDKARRESHADLMAIKESVLRLEAERERLRGRVAELEAQLAQLVEECEHQGWDRDQYFLQEARYALEPELKRD